MWRELEARPLRVRAYRVRDWLAVWNMPVGQLDWVAKPWMRRIDQSLVLDRRIRLLALGTVLVSSGFTAPGARATRSPPDVAHLRSVLPPFIEKLIDQGDVGAPRTCADGAQQFDSAVNGLKVSRDSPVEWTVVLPRRVMPGLTELRCRYGDGDSRVVIPDVCRGVAVGIG